MYVKVQGGTASGSDPSLCLHCRFATIIQGTSQRHQIVECSRLADHNRITFRVTSCTAFSDRRQPSLHDMQDMAWVLRSDPKRQQVGFVRARDLRAEDRVFFDEE